MRRPVLLCLLVLLALAPAAEAATVTYEAATGKLRIAAAAGEVNALTVTQSALTFTIADTGAPLSAPLAPECLVAPGGEVTCAVPVASAVEVALEDEDDALTAATDVPVAVEAGDGDDVVTGGAGADALEGNAGADVLDGAGGHDAYAAGDGDDEVLAEDGKKEAVDCGAGTDGGRADTGDTLTGCEAVAVPVAQVPPGQEKPKDDNGNHYGWDKEQGGEVPPGPKVAVPVPGRSVGVDVKKGVIHVRRPGTSKAVPLDPSVPVPVGSVLDATRGTLTLTTAATDAVGGATQAADFTGSRFVVGQKPGAPGTELKMTGGDFSVCRTASASSRPTAYAARRRTKRVRRLWGSGKGRFTTRGRNSSATVRGTIWSVEDRCNGTLTRVERGIVVVTDFARKRTKVVRAGESYFARRR